jgi:hypothetical protein
MKTIGGLDKRIKKKKKTERNEVSVMKQWMMCSEKRKRKEKLEKRKPGKHLSMKLPHRTIRSEYSITQELFQRLFHIVTFLVILKVIFQHILHRLKTLKKKKQEVEIENSTIFTHIDHF